MFIKSLSLLNNNRTNLTNALKRFLFTSNITYNKPPPTTPTNETSSTASTSKVKQPPAKADSIKATPKAGPKAAESKPATTIPAAKKAPQSLLHLLNGQKPEELAVHSEPGGLYYPPYLNKGPDFPNYEELEINLYGYDYTALDVFYKYVESLCKSFNCDINEAYPMPLREYKIKSYKPYSTSIQTELNLVKYHRIVSLDNVKSTIAPLLFETIQISLPEGVELEVKEPNEIESKFRYVPDVEIDDLKKELTELA